MRACVRACASREVQARSRRRAHRIGPAVRIGVAAVRKNVRSHKLGRLVLRRLDAPRHLVVGHGAALRVPRVLGARLDVRACAGSVVWVSSVHTLSCMAHAPRASHHVTGAVQAAFSVYACNAHAGLSLRAPASMAAASHAINTRRAEPSVGHRFIDAFRCWRGQSRARRTERDGDAGSARAPRPASTRAPARAASAGRARPGVARPEAPAPSPRTLFSL